MGACLQLTRAPLVTAGAMGTLWPAVGSPNRWRARGLVMRTSHDKCALWVHDMSPDQVATQTHGARVQFFYQCRCGKQEVMSDNKSCHCLKSRCLKLYCDCFARGAYCSGCACADCHNSEENASLVAERRAGIREKNPEVLHLLWRPHSKAMKYSPVLSVRICACWSQQ